MVEALELSLIPDTFTCHVVPGVNPCSANVMLYSTSLNKIDSETSDPETMIVPEDGTGRKVLFGDEMEKGWEPLYYLNS